MKTLMPESDILANYLIRSTCVAAPQYCTHPKHQITFWPHVTSLNELILASHLIFMSSIPQLPSTSKKSGNAYTKNGSLGQDQLFAKYSKLHLSIA